MSTRMKLGLAAVTMMMGVIAQERPANAEDVGVAMESPNPQVTLNRVTGQAVAQATGPGGTATASAISWEMVCVAPCNKAVDRQAMYFVTGDGVTSSGSFILPAKDRVNLKIDPGAAWMRATGITLTVLGGIATGIGAIVGLVGDTPTADEPDKGKSRQAAGWVTAGVGGTMLITGIVFWAISGTTVRSDGVTLAKQQDRPRAIQPKLAPTGIVF